MARLDEVRQDPAIGPVVVPRNPEGVGPEGGDRRQGYPDGHQTEGHQGVDGRPPPPAEDVSRSQEPPLTRSFSPRLLGLWCATRDVRDWPLGDEGAYLVRGAHRGQLSTATICPSAPRPPRRRGGPFVTLFAYKLSDAVGPTGTIWPHL